MTIVHENMMFMLRYNRFTIFNELIYIYKISV